MSRRLRAAFIAVAMVAPVLAIASPAHAMCTTGEITLKSKPSVTLPRCDDNP